MADREKVIKGLEDCTNGGLCFSDCPYFKEVPMTDGRCITALQADAIALLKEQEAVEPILKRQGRNKYYNYYVCRCCNEELFYQQNYCSECGRAVKWDDR